MANRRQQDLDAIQASLDGVEPTERACNVADADPEGYAEDYDIQVLEWVLLPRAQEIYSTIVSQGITVTQWFMNQKNTQDVVVLQYLVQQMIDDKKADEDFRKKVDDAWNYMIEHHMIPLDWMDKFNDERVYEELVDRWEMKMDHEDEWSGPTMPLSAVQNL